MVEAVPTPSLDRLAAEGAWTDEFVPTWPSISGATWVSLSTGCWPENHGVVTDKFLDPKRGLMDHDVDADWLTGCELLHQVAERQGVRAAVLGWWGQYSQTRGALASYVSRNHEAERARPRDINQYATGPERVDEILPYLGMPEGTRPRLILAHFRGPDIDAHFDGADAETTRAAVRRADAALGTLLEAISMLPDEDRIALLVLSDHGHVPVHSYVSVRRILSRHGIPALDVTTGSTAFLYFENLSEVDRAHDVLSRYEEFDVLRTSDLPEYARLGNGERVGELIVSAHPGYFTADADLIPWWLQPVLWWGPDVVEVPFLGRGIISNHGYPPHTPGVQGVFYAWGDGIEAAGRLGPVRMIDVHPTVTELLGLQSGRPVDGVALTNVMSASSEETGLPLR